MKYLLPLLLFSALLPLSSWADELPPPDAAPPTKPLVDRMHTGIVIRLDRYANYFDSFFATERADEEAANSQVRLIGALRLRESRGFDFSPRIKARFILPNLKQRVNLLIDTESDDSMTLADEMPDSVPQGNLKDNTSIALQLIQKSGADVGISHRLSLNMKDDKLNPQLRSQVRFSWQTSERDLLRLTQAAFWEKYAGFGQETRFDYEHLLHLKAVNRSSLLRITLRGLTSEASDGYEWSLPIEVLNALPNRRAYSYGGSISGVTDSSCGITNSAVFIRYRQSIWREWFYFDITPQLEWPKVKDRNTTTSIKLAFEMVF